MRTVSENPFHENMQFPQQIQLKNESFFQAFIVQVPKIPTHLHRLKKSEKRSCPHLVVLDPDSTRGPFCARSVASTKLYRNSPIAICQVLAGFISICIEATKVEAAQMASHFVLEEFWLEPVASKSP